MSQSTAKKIRKYIYGGMSMRDTKYRVVYGQVAGNTNTQVRADETRRIYQLIKKEWARRHKE